MRVALVAVASFFAAYIAPALALPAPPPPPATHDPAAVEFHAKDVKSFWSNYFEREFKYMDQTWKNAELAFQARKVEYALGLDEKAREQRVSEIRALSDPKDAPAKTSQLDLKDAWRQDRFPIMKEILYAKASGNEDIAKALRDTKDEPMTNQDDTDHTWGSATHPETKKPGQNRLGISWMDARTRLQEEFAEAEKSAPRVPIVE